MQPEIFFSVVVPLAIIIAVLVSVVYYLSRKTEETDFEKEMRALRISFYKGKIDRKTFLYMRENFKAENHFSEESKRLDAMFGDKKMDSDTYIRMKKVLEISFNDRLVKIEKKHNLN